MAGTASAPWRIGVLTSGHGRGSNLQALHRYFSERQLPVEIALVTVSRPRAPVRQLCAELDLPCLVLRTHDMALFEQALLCEIDSRRLDLIALAGFMKQLSAAFLTRVGIPVLNIHPALLPKYGGQGMYGLRVHEAVFASQEKVSGASVHRVDHIYDHGEVIARQQVDISDCRSPQEIADRVLKIEHQIYAPAILACLSRNHS